MAARKKRATKKRTPAKRRAPAKTTKRKPRKRSGSTDNPLTELRRQAQTVIRRLQQVGWQRINAIEKQIEALNRQRQALVDELGSVVGGVSGKRARRGSTSSGRGRRTRIDWDKVYAKLPRGSFQASDVKKLVPGVASGTLSQRLTAWVKAKKLRRTGSRRGTRYTRI